MSYRSSSDEGLSIGWIIALVIVVVVAIIGALFALTYFKRVDPGYAGVLIDYGQGTSDGKPKITSLETGRFVGVGWTQRLVQYPISQQTLTMVASSAEGQVKGDDSVKCQDKNGVPLRIDSSSLWRVNTGKVGEIYLLRPDMPVSGHEGADLSSTVVRREVRSAITTACSFFRYDEVFSNKKVEFGAKIGDILGPALEKTYIILDGFLLGEIHLEKEQEAAISAKVVAEQQSMQAQYLKQKAEYEALAKVAEAEGAAKVKVLQAEAEAKSIQVVNEQLGKSQFYVQYMYAKQWNGALPTTLVLSDGRTVPLVQNLPLLDGAEPVVPKPTLVPTAMPTIAPTSTAKP